MGPKFNILRACFILLAIIILSQVATIVAGGMTCFYLLIIGRAEVGSCSSFGTQAREIWAEALAAILALLLAAQVPKK